MVSFIDPSAISPLLTPTAVCHNARKLNESYIQAKNIYVSGNDKYTKYLAKVFCQFKK